MKYLLLWGYKLCHDGDDWVGIYDNTEDLKRDYYEELNSATDRGKSEKLFIYRFKDKKYDYEEIDIKDLI